MSKELESVNFTYSMLQTKLQTITELNVQNMVQLRQFQHFAPVYKQLQTEFGFKDAPSVIARYKKLVRQESTQFERISELEDLNDRLKRELAFAAEEHSSSSARLERDLHESQRTAEADVTALQAQVQQVEHTLASKDQYEQKYANLSNAVSAVYSNLLDAEIFKVKLEPDSSPFEYLQALELAGQCSHHTTAANRLQHLATMANMQWRQCGGWAMQAEKQQQKGGEADKTLCMTPEQIFHQIAVLARRKKVEADSSGTQVYKLAAQVKDLKQKLQHQIREKRKLHQTVELWKGRVVSRKTGSGKAQQRTDVTHRHR